jgi:hypothetical protein
MGKKKGPKKLRKFAKKLASTLLTYIMCSENEGSLNNYPAPLPEKRVISARCAEMKILGRRVTRGPRSS